MDPRTHTRLSSFGKVETYMKFKAALCINSRSDVFKCFSGPYFKLMESEVYKDPAFIKHTPVRLRPQYIMEMMGANPGPYYETDYSQFEKHFTRPVMLSLEMILYAHLLRNHPGALREIRRAMLGTNRCTFRHFQIKISARRMSGEMCTSLGNGFSNLMLAKFVVFHKTGRDDLVGVVEGDDGLFVCPCELCSEDFRELGFDIKIITHASLLRSSFCGIVMSEDLATMTDPRAVLVNFGWSHSPVAFGGHKVQMSLLRAKALSLAYEHPCCPILSVLALRVLHLTARYAPRFEGNTYERELFIEAQRFESETYQLLKRGPTAQTRSDFAETFGVPLWQQLAVERELSVMGLGEISGTATLSLFDEQYEDCRRYYEEFCHHGRVWTF